MQFPGTPNTFLVSLTGLSNEVLTILIIHGTPPLASRSQSRSGGSDVENDEKYTIFSIFRAV